MGIWQVDLSCEAFGDLKGIVTTLGMANSQVAYRIGLRLVHAMRSLELMPYRGVSCQHRASKRRLVHGPYEIIYEVAEPERVVRVWRIWTGWQHARRMPAHQRAGSSA